MWQNIAPVSKPRHLQNFVPSPSGTARLLGAARVQDDSDGWEKNNINANKTHVSGVERADVRVLRHCFRRDEWRFFFFFFFYRSDCAGQLHTIHLLYDNKGTYIAVIKHAEGGNPPHTCTPTDTMPLCGHSTQNVCLPRFLLYICEMHLYIHV